MVRPLRAPARPRGRGRPVAASPDDELDLPLAEADLPPLDGDDDEAEAAFEELDTLEDDGDALDDATGEGDPVDDLEADGAESGWLLEPDDASSLDIGELDLNVADEASVLDDEEAVEHPADEELGGAEDRVAFDGGEEGPLADDEELREEDLPALDADEDGEVDEGALFDRAALAADDELLWDDRAWARVDAAPSAADETADDSGAIVAPGEDPAQRTRDDVWRRLDDGGRVTAAALVPGGSVVVALDSADRSRAVLVRIRPDGEARIIAEIDAPAGEDDGDVYSVTSLRWDGARGVLSASGTFGVQAFRPA